MISANKSGLKKIIWLILIFLSATCFSVLIIGLSFSSSDQKPTYACANSFYTKIQFYSEGRWIDASLKVETDNSFGVIPCDIFKRMIKENSIAVTYKYAVKQYGGYVQVEFRTSIDENVWSAYEKIRELDTYGCSVDYFYYEKDSTKHYTDSVEVTKKSKDEAEILGFDLVGSCTNSASLGWIRDKINAGIYTFNRIRLANDIDLENKEWTPIGLNYETSFFGTFDGEGHTIKNFKITSPQEAPGIGFFGCLYSISDVTIKNLCLSNVQIKLNDTKYSSSWGIGCLVGFYGFDEDKNYNEYDYWYQSARLIINNCVVENSLVNIGAFEVDDNSIGIGGVVGSSKTNVSIVDCESKVQIIINALPRHTGFLGVGGVMGAQLCGYLTYAPLGLININKCLFKGEILIKGILSQVMIGGIMGGGDTLKTNFTSVCIINCYSIIKINDRFGNSAGINPIYAGSLKAQNPDHYFAWYRYDYEEGPYTNAKMINNYFDYTYVGSSSVASAANIFGLGLRKLNLGLSNDNVLLSYFNSDLFIGSESQAPTYRAIA